MGQKQSEQNEGMICPPDFPHNLKDRKIEIFELINLLFNIINYWNVIL